MIFSSILASCYQRLSLASAPDADTIARIKQFANDTVREILSDTTIAQEVRRKVLPFASIANAQLCALPQVATRIHNIVDRTNRRYLTEVSIDWIRKRDPGLAFGTTTPSNYAIRGYSAPYFRVPAASGQMVVVSSAAETPIAYIEVITAVGYMRQANVTLTGVTPANLGPADTLDINDFYLSAVATGEVSLKDAAANVLAVIGIGKYRSRYTLLELYPFTTSAVPLYADCDVEITDLVNATDECLIPDEFTEAVICGVRKREYQKRLQWEAADRAQADQKRIISRLRHAMVARSLARERAGAQWSQLGPWYPAGS